MSKNLQSKTRPKDKPYEVWQFKGWFWWILKKWQADDSKPYGRWFCLVKTPIVPDGELGDVYVSEIKHVAEKIYDEANGIGSMEDVNARVKEFLHVKV